MRIPAIRLSLRQQLLLLPLFCLVLAALWLFPVFVVGEVYRFPQLLTARNVAVSGFFSSFDAIGRVLAPSLLPSLGVPNAADGRLSALLEAFMSRGIAWDNLLGWTVANAFIMAAAMGFFWLAVCKHFGPRVAWISTVVLALFPLTWQQALVMHNYTFAFFFLFLGLAVFAWLREQFPLSASVGAGLCFGLSLSSKDAFMVFLPWIVLSVLFLGRDRWKTAVLRTGLFLFFVLFVYLLPYAGDIARYGYPANQNLARLWPGASGYADETYLHLYPDPYTYFFDRDRFDRETVAAMGEKSPLERAQEQKMLIVYGLEKGWGASLLNGIWLSLNTIPSFFQTQTIGGVVLWLFMLPGFVLLRRRDRRMFWLLTGLLFSSYFLIRFVLHFEREHLMDFAWIFALAAGIGASSAADVLSAAWRPRAATAFAVIIAVLLSGHLMQANRLLFAPLYLKSDVPTVREESAQIAALPADSVVALSAHPTSVEALALLSGRTIAYFNEKTVERLVAGKQLRSAMDTYGVTHLYGYPPALTAKAVAQVPALRAVPPAPAPAAEPTPVMKFLLHLLR